MHVLTVSISRWLGGPITRTIQSYARVRNPVNVVKGGDPLGELMGLALTDSDRKRSARLHRAEPCPVTNHTHTHTHALCVMREKRGTSHSAYTFTEFPPGKPLAHSLLPCD